MIERATRVVLRYMAIHQPYARASDFCIRISQVGFALAQSFDFGTHKRHSGFHLFEEVVVIASGAILGNDFLPRCIFFGGFLSSFSHEGLS